MKDQKILLAALVAVSLPALFHCYGPPAGVKGKKPAAHFEEQQSIISNPVLASPEQLGVSVHSSPLHNQAASGHTPNYAENPFLNGAVHLNGPMPVVSNVDQTHSGNNQQPNYSNNPFLGGSTQGGITHGSTTSGSTGGITHGSTQGSGYPQGGSTNGISQGTYPQGGITQGSGYPQGGVTHGSTGGSTQGSGYPQGGSTQGSGYPQGGITHGSTSGGTQGSGYPQGGITHGSTGGSTQGSGYPQGGITHGSTGGSTQGSGGSYPQQGSGGISQVTISQGPVTSGSNKPDYSQNPFLTGQVSSQPQKPGTFTGSGYPASGTTVSCSAGTACVNKQFCNNGFVNQNNVQYAKPQNQPCSSTSGDMCCSVTSRQDGPGLVHVNPNQPSPGLVHVNPNQPAPGLVNPGGNQPGFLAPGSSAPVGSAIRNPNRPATTFKPYDGPQNTTPHPGCAAALKCVTKDFCTWDGIMADVPQVLNRDEQENRVPLSDCANPETGVIGVCCRDPNYKDPWPDMLPGGGCYDGTRCEVMEQCDNNRMAQPKATCNLAQSGSVGICCIPKGSNIQPGFQFQYQPSQQASQAQVLPQRPPPQTNYPQKPAPQPTFPQQNNPQPGFVNKPGTYPAPNPQPGFVNPSQPGNSGTFPQQPVNSGSFSQQPGNSGTFPQQPVNSGSFQQQQKPVHSGTFPQQPVNSGSFQQQKPVNSGTFPQQPVNSGSFQQQQKPVNSGSFTQQPVHSGTFPQQPVNSGSFQQQQKPVNSGSFPQQPVNSGSYPQQPIGSPQQPGFTHPKPDNSATYPGSIDKVDPNPPVFEIGQPTDTELSQQFENPTYPKPSTNPPHTSFFQQQSPSGINNNQQQAGGYPRPQRPQAVVSETTLLPAQYPQLSTQHRPGQLCGVRRVSQVSGLTGNDGQTVPGEFPWLVLVTLPANHSRLCAGALISDKAVLTSAHCVLGFSARDIQVEVGSWSPYESNPERQSSSVVAIAKHPRFESGSLFNDMAVLLLPSPLRLGQHVDLVCLPEPEQIGQDGELINPSGACVMSSWPKQGGAESYLHRLAVNAVPRVKCEESLRQTYLGKYFQLNRSFMCATPVNPQHDICSVALGGPLVCPQQDGRYVVTGASSWDVGCSERRSPAVMCSLDVTWVNEVLTRPVEDFIQSQEQQQQVNVVSPDVGKNKPGFSQGYGK